MNKGNILRDLTGQQFGQWRVLSRAEGKDYDGAPVWNCECSCGVLRVVRGTPLKRGSSRSCGCASRMDPRLRQGSAYNSWKGMSRRCYQKSHHRYKYYGARGIKVCERWKTFKNFLEDMGQPPQGASIDRIDNDKDYEPGNCRWATPKEQAVNKGPYRKRITAKDLIGD